MAFQLKIRVGVHSFKIHQPWYLFSLLLSILFGFFLELWVNYKEENLKYSIPCKFWVLYHSISMYWSGGELKKVQSQSERLVVNETEKIFSLHLISALDTAISTISLKKVCSWRIKTTSLSLKTHKYSLVWILGSSQAEFQTCFGRVSYHVCNHCVFLTKWLRWQLLMRQL